MVFQRQRVENFFKASPKLVKRDKGKRKWRDLPLTSGAPSMVMGNNREMCTGASGF